MFAAALVLTGCGTDAPRDDSADRAFLQNMIAHHRRAIAAAQVGVRQARDPRVRTFARRIVAEQSPELARMTARVADLRLSIDASAGNAMARNRITDGQLAELKGLRGRQFDVDFLTLHISSEQGAAAMARIELAGGTDADSLALANNIAGAPTSEIPELEALRTALK